MDQRRVVVFLALSVLVLILFAPKKTPRDNKLAQENDRHAEVEPLPKVQAEEPQATAEPPLPPEAGPEAKDQEPKTNVGLEYFSLGSVAEDSPYRILVTFTNHGAGVRRVELASRRYRDLQDRGGYLGHLELASDPAGGLLIQAVGSGTPAAQAGLEIGDRILSSGGKGQPLTLSSPQQFAELLAQNKPGELLVLQVARGEAPPTDRTVALGRRPLEVMRPESENVLMRTEKLPNDSVAPPSFQFTFEQLGSTKIGKEAAEIVGVELRESHWEIVDRNETSVTFRKRLPRYALEVLKRYRLEPIPAEQLANTDYPGYGLKLDLEIHNLGEKEINLAYQLDGPNGLPVEGWWYANKIGRNWGAAGIRDMIARYEGNETVQFGPTDIALGKVEPMQGPPLAFIGIDAQYFSAVMLPLKPSLSDIWIDEARAVSLSPKPKARSAEGRYVNVTCRLISRPQLIEGGGSLKHSYQIFTGPKRPGLLSQYLACESSRYSLSDLLYYGWFSAVAKLMLSILHFFYRFVGNYGISIILLTVLVRSCMFPISRKQALSMAKMQVLKPEMDRLKEKYKSDMQKQSQAMQELYRKHNINPLAGCLPMFVQLPIFLGLYRALMVDVELRQAPLLGEAIRWCSNLAAPDMFFNWSSMVPEFISSGVGILGLGPYLNVLPLISSGLFLLQQKLFMPEPANEQAAMQQKIMKFMMPLMGLLFFKFASGLCLYFIASGIWGIAERKLVPSPTAPGAAKEDSKKSAPLRESKNGQAKNAHTKKKSKKKR